MRWFFFLLYLPFRVARFGLAWVVWAGVVFAVAYLAGWL